METGITLDQVIEIHKVALKKYKGLEGVNVDRLEGALGRIDKQLEYNPDLVDIFEIAAWYLVSIAKAHAFNDGNKRTALITALTYLSIRGFDIPEGCGLDDFMVEVAASHEDHERLVLKVADCLYEVAAKYNDLPDMEDEDPMVEDDIA